MLPDYTILELQSLMASGQLSAEDICQAYLARIKDIDPTLNAVIECNPEAIEIAVQCDAERRQDGPRSPLHGVPIMLKDNINTADKMMTTAGSLALDQHYAPEDAFIVKRLREAGAVILAKTNLSEWANFRGQWSSSGWSSRGGQTRNPYDLKRSPCGSSSGSAVAVAANLCVAAVGTETDGSVTCPSSVNGVVGLKPSIGVLSRSGIIPIAHSQDTAGPMTKTVRDNAIMLASMMGHDDRDVSMPVRRAFPEDIMAQLKADALDGMRLGVVTNLGHFHPSVLQCFAKAQKVMQAKGAQLIEVELETASYSHSELEVLLYEFKHDLNDYLQNHAGKLALNTIDDIIQFNQKHPEVMMPHFGQELMLKAAQKGALDDQAYLDALANNHQKSRQEGIDACLREHDLDAMIAPSTGPAWLIDWVTGDYGSGSSSKAAAVAGYPHISVPMGYVKRMPVGLSIFSAAFRDIEVLNIAYAFEQATLYRKPPVL